MKEAMARVEQLSIQKYILIRAIVELTYRCNFRCVHCYIDRAAGPGGSRPPGFDPQPELTTEEWKRVFSDLAGQGCLYLTLIGGEVFARPDFFELARDARRRRFALRLISNGSFIGDGEARMLKALGFMAVDVSLYGATAETCRRVTGHPRAFEKTVAGIEALLAHGHRVTLKVPLMKENFADFRAMAAMAEAWGVRIQFDPLLTPMTDTGNPEPVGHRLDREQLKEFYGWQSRPVVARPRLPEDMVCVSGRNTITISPFGDIYPCMQIKKPLGNVRRDRLADVWRTSPALARMRALRFRDLAYTDREKAHCVICPGVALLEAGDVSARSDYACRMAEVQDELGLFRPG